jgi:hypothetical protein
LLDRLSSQFDFFRCGANFQQLQQWKIDTGKSIYPVLAASFVARWEHIELPADFLQLLNSFLL